jgi:hypothetical protein
MVMVMVTVSLDLQLKTNSCSLLKESVFERLASPHNYTGTQKAKFEEKIKSPRKPEETTQTTSPRQKTNPTSSTSGVRPHSNYSFFFKFILYSPSQNLN